MADEAEFIRRRLLTKTSTPGKSSLKKCAENLLSFLETIADEAADENLRKQERDNLLWEIEQLEFEATKTDVMNYTCQRELEAYEKLHADIDSSIEKVTKEIEDLKTKVHTEKIIRAYKEEYESISRVINEYPSRKEIAAEIAIEKKRLEESKEMITRADTKLDLRIKQFSLLMSTIQNLKATLDEDAEMEEAEDQQKEVEDEEMDEPGVSKHVDDDDEMIAHSP